MSQPEHELHTLLVRWAELEPERCRLRDDAGFEVYYLSHWIAVTTQPISHGAIIAAVIGGCQENRVHCTIDYTPRYRDEPPTLEVGCIPRAGSYDSGDSVISSIPVLLLGEYLERMES